MRTSTPTGMGPTHYQVGEWYHDNDFSGTAHLVTTPYRLVESQTEYNIDVGFVVL